MDVDADAEQYILLLLSDGNLPTGSFVASSGLESHVKHGFSKSSVTSTEKMMDFIRDSLHSYAHSALPFVTDAHVAVCQEFSAWSWTGDQAFERLQCREQIIQLDALYDTMTLNHVARRASKAQGVALLTLFARGFSRPSWLESNESDDRRWSAISSFINHIKLDIRRETTHGYLPVCWGVLTGVLGLSVERSQYLHLFLHARALLSAAIRMNVIGPYAAQQLLLHAIRPLVDAQLTQCQHIRTGVIAVSGIHAGLAQTTHNDVMATVVEGPANTWPLGEILAARHDLQHSRMFNS